MFYLYTTIAFDMREESSNDENLVRLFIVGGLSLVLNLIYKISGPLSLESPGRFLGMKIDKFETWEFV